MTRHRNPAPPWRKRETRHEALRFSRRLLFEELETRSMLNGDSNLVVTNTADSGAGSLRSAILYANVTANVDRTGDGTVDPDTITFAIPDPGVQTIQPLTPLPPITEPVIIDGYSQPGAAMNSSGIGWNGTLLIELDGSRAGLNVDGLNITAGGSTVRGLVINRFSDDGIDLNTAGGNIVLGNFLGTDPTGTIARGNGNNGIELTGISNNSIGRSFPEARNLISGNGNGVFVQGPSATENHIEANYVGTNADGTAALANGNGIVFQSASSNFMVANVVSGNSHDGLDLVGVVGLLDGDSDLNLVWRNIVGANVNLQVAIPNGEQGIKIVNASQNSIGGISLEQANVITANLGNGILVQGSAAVDNALLRNSIFANGLLGIDLSVTSPAPDGVTANDAGDADTGPNGLQNFPVITAISRSFSLPPLPPGPKTRIQGTLNSTPSTQFRIELFVSDSPDASGYGEGQTFLGFATATTDPVGNATFDFLAQDVIPAGRFITATATPFFVTFVPPFHNPVSHFLGTSEFSAAKEVLQPQPILVTGADAGGGPHVKVFNATTGAELFSFFAYDANFKGGVRVATGDVNGDGTPDIITGAGPGGGPHVRVFDGRTGTQFPGVIGSFFAYDASFTGGVFVAAGDVNGDGRADIITGAGAGGGPHVKVFSGLDGSELYNLFPFTVIPPKGPPIFFTGGVAVAAGDVSGDGKADIIVAAGAGGTPEVQVYSGATGQQLPGPIGSFLAYGPTFSGGVFVAAGDVNGDGKADIVTGAGAGGGPHVKVFNGVTGAELRSFFAYAANFTGGVRVGAADLNVDGIADIITGAGPGGGPHVRVFSGVNGAELASFFPYSINFTGGVFVAGAAPTSPGAAVQLLEAPATAPNSLDIVSQEQLDLIRAAALLKWQEPGSSQVRIKLIGSSDDVLDDYFAQLA